MMENKEFAKVVLTKAQAKVVEDARNDGYPASYISHHTGVHDGEELLMSAYVNGYTVASEKK